MDKTIESSDSQQGACACGQRFLWHAVSSRQVVVVSFQKNLFEFSDRFEYPAPSAGPLQFACAKCRKAVTLEIAPAPVARKVERVKTAPVPIPVEALPPGHRD